MASLDDFAKDFASLLDKYVEFSPKYRALEEKVASYDGRIGQLEERYVKRITALETELLLYKTTFGDLPADDEVPVEAATTLVAASASVFDKLTKIPARKRFPDGTVAFGGEQEPYRRKLPKGVTPAKHYTPAPQAATTAAASLSQPAAEDVAEGGEGALETDEIAEMPRPAGSGSAGRDSKAGHALDDDDDAAKIPPGDTSARPSADEIPAESLIPEGAPPGRASGRYNGVLSRIARPVLYAVGAGLLAYTAFAAKSTIDAYKEAAASADSLNAKLSEQLATAQPTEGSTESAVKAAVGAAISQHDAEMQARQQALQEKLDSIDELVRSAKSDEDWQATQLAYKQLQESYKDDPNALSQITRESREANETYARFQRENALEGMPLADSGDTREGRRGRMLKVSEDKPEKKKAKRNNDYFSEQANALPDNPIYNLENAFTDLGNGAHQKLLDEQGEYLPAVKKNGRIGAFEGIEYIRHKPLKGIVQTVQGVNHAVTDVATGVVTLPKMIADNTIAKLPLIGKPLAGLVSLITKSAKVVVKTAGDIALGDAWVSVHEPNVQKLKKGKLDGLPFVNYLVNQGDVRTKAAKGEITDDKDAVKKAVDDNKTYKGSVPRKAVEFSGSIMFDWLLGLGDWVSGGGNGGGVKPVPGGGFIGGGETPGPGIVPAD